MSQSSDTVLLAPLRFPIIDNSPIDNPQQISVDLSPNLDVSSPFEITLRISATSTPLPSSPIYELDANRLWELADKDEGADEIIDLIGDNDLVRRTWLHFQHCRHTAWRLEREARQQKEIADTLFEHLRMDGINEILRPMIRQTQSSYFTAPSSTPPLSPPRPSNPMPPTDDSVSLATPSTPSSPCEEGMDVRRPIIIVSDSSSESPTPSPPSSSSSSSSSSRKRAGSPLPQQQRGLRHVRSMVAGPSRS